MDLSSSAGFNALPSAASAPVQPHEDEDIESTYAGLVALFEGNSDLQSAMNVGASWLAVLSHDNTSARTCALDAYCGLLMRHAEHIDELVLTPRAHWHVENFSNDCFERIACAIWSRGFAPSRLKSINLSHLCMINENILEVLLCYHSQRQQLDDDEGFDETVNPLARPLLSSHDIPTSGIPTLEALNLNSCRLPGIIPSRGLAGCPCLRELDLGGCNYTGAFRQSSHG
jgi:hypothetical protein